MKYYAGIDLGGTFIKLGILDSDGNIVCKTKIPTGSERAYHEIAQDMVDCIDKLISDNNLSKTDVVAIGIGSPGSIDSKKGVIVYSNNLYWKNVPLADVLKEKSGLPVFITNDANAAALGEHFCGGGKKYSSMILVTLGTGVGGGIIIDGNLFEGNKSAGTEIGHEVIRMGGEKCTCGRRGCFEAYASATALIRQTKRAMEKDKSSKLWELCGGNIDEVNGKTPFDAMELEDKTGEKVVKKYINYLAEGITNIANVFRPEIILLGGGICAQGDNLLKPLRRRVNRLIYGTNKYATVKIDIAQLGNDAGLYGAARLAMIKTQKN